MGTNQNAEGSLDEGRVVLCTTEVGWLIGWLPWPIVGVEQLDCPHVLISNIGAAM